MSGDAYARGAGYRMKTVGTPEPQVCTYPDEVARRWKAERDTLRALIVRCKHVLTTLDKCIVTDRPELLRAAEGVKLESILWQIEESALLASINEALADVQL